MKIWSRKLSVGIFSAICVVMLITVIARSMSAAEPEEYVARDAISNSAYSTELGYAALAPGSLERGDRIIAYTPDGNQTPITVRSVENVGETRLKYLDGFPDKDVRRYEVNSEEGGKYYVLAWE